jgi:ribosomal protein L21E
MRARDHCARVSAIREERAMTEFRWGDRVRVTSRFPEDPYSGFVGIVADVGPESYVVGFGAGRFETYRWFELRPADISPQESDSVNHPAHYTAYKGVEVIDLVEQLNFNRGNAVKYVARAGLKNPDTEIEDLEKAAWYIRREIARLKGGDE